MIMVETIFMEVVKLIWPESHDLAQKLTKSHFVTAHAKGC